MDKQPIIWIVEDDVTMQRMVAEQLKAHQFTPVVFNSAEKAHEAFGTQPLPALLILDMLLPGMSGVDFIRLIKQNKVWEKIPIVVVSVLAQKEGEDQVAYWINKPFDASNLIQTVQKVLTSVGPEEKQA